MAAAMGLAERGNAFVRFANGKSIARHGGAQILEKIASPLVFTWGTGGAQQPPSEINGYDVTLLIETDILKASLNLDQHHRIVGIHPHLKADHGGS